MSSDYDVLVLGGGTAGILASRAARARGARTVVIERSELLGGECTFTGCVPSKTLIEVARTYWAVRNGASVGISVDNLRLDFGALMRHKNAVIADINRDEAEAVFTDAGIDVLHGAARFSGPHTALVGDREIRADHIVLCQGTDPAIPPIDGLDDVPYLTNESIFDLTELPRRLVVLGGGPIGLELGQCFLRLGSEVTVVASTDHLLPREDPEAASVVGAVLAREGMELHMSAKADRVHLDGGDIVLEFVVDGQRQSVRGDRLLIATGRRPRLAGMGLEHLGLTPPPTGIPVDAHLRTTVPHVFAAGDVLGTLLFTHVASYEGRVAGTNAAGGHQKVDYRVIPWVTFLDPEVARVGLTEEEARAQHGSSVDVVRFPFSRIDRARTMKETDGFVKLVVRRPPLIGNLTGGGILGAHIVGPHAGEMLHEVVVAMQTRAFAGRLAQAVHAYPTLSLGVQQAASQLYPSGRALVDAEDLDAIRG